MDDSTINISISLKYTRKSHWKFWREQILQIAPHLPRTAADQKWIYYSTINISISIFQNISESLTEIIFSSQEVLISLYFWIKEMLVSCQDLSPNRPFQELRQVIQNNQLHQLKTLSFFKIISPILVVGLKNQMSSAQIGGLLLLPLRLPRPWAPPAD